jgi:hypothetical protein
LVTVTRYVPAAKVVGTAATIAVFEKVDTVREVPPTVIVGATPVGLKFEPARVRLPVVKFIVVKYRRLGLADQWRGKNQQQAADSSR